MNIAINELDILCIEKAVAINRIDILTDETLENFTVMQITKLIDVAIENNRTECTALLMDYKNRHFDFSDMSEFILDWKF